jgi:uncharacterized membrane protein YgdD (TMEM256/DUF423 family)
MQGERFWISIGAILAGLAVVNGALAAHFLEVHFAKKYADGAPKSVAGVDVPLSLKRLQDFRTGAEYQMYHALGLVAVGLLCRSRSSKSLATAGWSFLLGIVFFSGSLYVLTLTGTTWWGAITPIGGVLFTVGWLALAIAAFSPVKASTRDESGESPISARMRSRIPTENRN